MRFGVRPLRGLHPGVCVLFLGVHLLIATYLVPETSYLTVYRSQKHVDFGFVLAGLVVYVVFLAGTLFTVRAGARPQGRDVLLYCHLALWPLFALTVFVYVPWCVYAASRTGGFWPVNDLLFDVVFNPTPGLTDRLKYEVFEAIFSITTSTQFSILYTTGECLRNEKRIVGERAARIAVLRLDVRKDSLGAAVQ